MNSDTSTALTVKTEALPVRSLDDLKTLGGILSQSGMFGTQNPAEAIVVAAMCHQDRVSYSEWMQNNHMIKGKVSKRADAIYADFLRRGGKVKIKHRSEDGVIVILKKDDNEQEFKLMWSDAVKEPFVYNGSESDVCAALASGDTARLKVKPKYQTPRSRMQMLWARVISDAVRTMDPVCCQGVYTPEEVEDFTDAARVAIAQPYAGEEARPLPKPPKPSKVAQKPEPEDAEIVQPEAVEKPEPIPVQAEPAPAKKVEAHEEPEAKQVNDALTKTARATAKAAAAKAIADKKKTAAATDTGAGVEPTPFDDPVDQPEQESKEAYDRCPIEGKLLAKKWLDMPINVLEYAKANYADRLKPEHMIEIDKAIDFKK